MARKRKADVEQWAAKRLAALDIDGIVPDPDQEPITEKQVSFIMSLMPGADREKVERLGKWQASDLITTAIDTREKVLSMDSPEASGEAEGYGCLASIAIAIGIMLTLAAGLYLLVNGLP